MILSPAGKEKIMAEKKTEDTRVEVFVPRGRKNEDPNVFIGVNGVNYLLPRGQKSMVPPSVAAVYARSQAAQIKFDETVDGLLGKAQTPLSQG